MIPKIRKYIHNDRAETNYVSTVVYILVVVVTLAVIMDVLAVVMTKQKLDTAADQVTRQIQLAGRVDDDTEDLLDFLGTDLGKASALTYHVDTTYITKECREHNYLSTKNSFLHIHQSKCIFFTHQYLSRTERIINEIFTRCSLEKS